MIALRLPHALAALFIAAPASGIDVHVDFGETLTEQDLLAGVFLGQVFELGPETTFQINAGGAIQPISFSGSGDVDFQSSLVQINPGGRYVDTNFFDRTVINLRMIAADDAVLDGGFEVGAGCDILIEGGTADGLIYVVGDSHIEITGGSQGLVSLGSGASARFAGGRRLLTNSHPGSVLTLVGDDLHLNDNEIDPDDPDEDYSGLGAIGGTHPDGVGFVEYSSLSTISTSLLGEVRLEYAALPEPDRTPIVVPDQPAPAGLRPGQSLWLRAGGELPSGFSAIGTEMIIAGGTIGTGFNLLNSVCSVTGGSLNTTQVFGESSLFFAGGELRGFLGIFPGSSLEVVHGEINGQIRLLHAEAFISGGSHASIAAQGESQVEITGGDFRSTLEIEDTSSVRLAGGTVRDLEMHDDTTFLFESGSVERSVVMSGSPTVRLLGGVLPDRAELLGTIEMEGGLIGDDSSITEGTTLVMSGGVIGDGFLARRANTIELSAGSIGDGLVLSGASTLLITGGSVGAELNCLSRSNVVMSGGSLGERCTLNFENQMTVSGGTVGEPFYLASGTLELFVRSAMIDGTPVPIEPGERITVGARDVRLDAELADGSPIGFFLNSNLLAFDLGYFNSGATLALVGASPSPCGTADLAEPFATLDLDDVVRFVNAFLAQEPIADFNTDGVLGLDDITAFIEAFAAGCVS